MSALKFFKVSSNLCFMSEYGRGGGNVRDDLTIDERERRFLIYQKKVRVEGRLQLNSTLENRLLKVSKDNEMESSKRGKVIARMIASKGWSESFLDRENITFKNLTSESASADLVVAEAWKSQVPGVVDDHPPGNQLNGIKVASDIA
ncbi:hypothetical protein QAD02_007875 [Eretmocerus hayati]|uniref:Uncharacterized protein n=1 Tax=Eretmocerus hayati TaxID=131215 RepID=A0ACC2N671_9HYME|nr:hypothetical protein QAD02_007875 [Eretmocerus hayati]